MALVLGIRNRMICSVARRNTSVSRSEFVKRILQRNGKKWSSPQKSLFTGMGLGMIAGVYVYARVNTAYCADDSAVPSDDPKSDPVASMISKFSPIINKLGMGGLVGVCAGYASKRLGKEVAFIIGCGFLVLQYLQEKGYIAIQYKKAQDDILKELDQNKDGKFDTQDVLAWWQKASAVITHNIPGSSGFLAGYAMGIWYM
eukprot:CAMPEP_0182427492 /NCGR_PEP_ID=MMETSP1167-20130531/17825_1 /TAXON_ID=2988 /ORGANISM="Mallomonas Sp, Strain CCMP3275" /LENGTH=200 /DNA_ID=CAMNT_0024609777 /DNA_START=80 /DNA_END=682 /DNA_ORIENTATION=+